MYCHQVLLINGPIKKLVDTKYTKYSIGRLERSSLGGPLCSITKKRYPVYRDVFPSCNDFWVNQ